MMTSFPSEMMRMAIPAVNHLLLLSAAQFMTLVNNSPKMFEHVMHITMSCIVELIVMAYVTVATIMLHLWLTFCRCDCRNHLPSLKSPDK